MRSATALSTKEWKSALWAAETLPYCKCADVTDIEALRQLGIADIDTVVIKNSDSDRVNAMNRKVISY